MIAQLSLDHVTSNISKNVPKLHKKSGCLKIEVHKRHMLHC